MVVPERKRHRGLVRCEPDVKKPLGVVLLTEDEKPSAAGEESSHRVASRIGAADDGELTLGWFESFGPDYGDGYPIVDLIQRFDGRMTDAERNEEIVSASGGVV